MFIQTVTEIGGGIHFNVQRFDNSAPIRDVIRSVIRGILEAIHSLCAYSSAEEVKIEVTCEAEPLD